MYVLWPKAQYAWIVKHGRLKINTVRLFIPDINPIIPISNFEVPLLFNSKIKFVMTKMKSISNRIYSSYLVFTHFKIPRRNTNNY